MINILIREFAPEQTVADQNALEQFQEQWSTYQKLVDADALSHRAAGKLLHDALYAIPRPFAFVGSFSSTQPASMASTAMRFKPSQDWARRNGGSPQE